MAGAALQIELVSPQHDTVTLSASRVILPGTAGIFTVLPEHTPLLTTLKHGVVFIQGEDEEYHYAVHEGFAEVANDHITVLANAMELGDNIDVPRAQAALDRARLRIEKRERGTEIPRAEAAMARALARLKARSREGY